ncbi:hypothetical protein ABVT39_006421 [Epinephelus coioides]
MAIISYPAIESSRSTKMAQNLFTKKAKLETDFELCIQCQKKDTKDTNFITGVGNKKQTIALKPVVHALGKCMAAALLGFHAFSGADQTGRFAGKGNLTCWQALNRCPVEVVSAFAALGTTEKLSPDTEQAIEAFVCQL